MIRRWLARRRLQRIVTRTRESFPAEPVSRLGPSGVDPLRVWAVIEKHAAEVRLVFLLDLLRVLWLRLAIRKIGA